MPFKPSVYDKWCTQFWKVIDSMSEIGILFYKYVSFKKNDKWYVLTSGIGQIKKVRNDVY